MSQVRRCLMILVIYQLIVSAKAAEFTPLPAAAAPTEIRALGISDDGNTVVGIVQKGSQNKAFRWLTTDPQLTAIDDLAGGAEWNQATAISGNGQVVVGQGTSIQGTEALRQEGNNPPVGLSDLPDGFFASRATGVSHNGNFVAGTGHSMIGREAFLWSAETGIQGLGFLPNGVASEANDISSNGTIVVGMSETFDVILGEAFRWTAAEGMLGLGDLAGGDAMSRAAAVSSTGFAVVGTSSSIHGTEAFRWTPGGGMHGLGDLPGGGFESFAYDVSEDGSVVVGAGATHNANGGAFLWTAENGIQPLADLLRNEHDLGPQLTGWDLLAAHAISPDGRVIVGTGINPDGQFQGWRVALGETSFVEGGQVTEDVVLRLGDQLQGHGHLSGHVRIGAGATIRGVGGDLTLGSNVEPDSVQIAGRVKMDGHQLQLQSANAVPVSGSIIFDHTTLNSQERSQVSYDVLSLEGVIQYGDLTGQRLDLQSGAVLGHSMSQPAVISGQITGQGYLDYVEILDELAPGNGDPAQLSLGSVRYRSASIALDVHDASQNYDQVDHRGTAEIAGSVRVDLQPAADYLDPDSSGEFNQLVLLSAATLTIVDDASIALTFAGQPLGTLTRANETATAHVGSGLFRIAELENSSLKLTNYRAIAGDADGDGRFGTADLIHVLQRGKYEDLVPLNADWTEGDWNLDGEFDSGDLVTALQTGAYELASSLPATAAVPEPACWTLVMLGLLGIAAARERIRSMK